MRNDETSILVREILGRNLKALRTEGNFSQSSFSRMVAIDRSYINRIENGEGNITLDIIIKLADGLDVPITVLFDGLQDESPRRCLEKKINYGSTEFPDSSDRSSLHL